MSKTMKVPTKEELQTRLEVVEAKLISSIEDLRSGMSEARKLLESAESSKLTEGQLMALDMGVELIEMKLSGM